MTNLDSILKDRAISLPTKVHLVKAMVFPSHVWIWELDYKESWALKNWCIWTVVLEKTLESPLDWKEIQPVNPKGNQSWIFIGRTDAEAGTPILGHLTRTTNSFEKTLRLAKIWRQKKKRTTEDEMAAWHHWLDGHESVWTLGIGDGHGGVSCCDSWGHKESDTTERLNWGELKLVKIKQKSRADQ